MAKIQHMVLLKFRAGVSDSEIARMFESLHALRSVIPGIDHLAGGPYSSPEGFNQGYTHGFLVTFASAAARDAYLTHPAHEEVKQAILEILDAGVAFDFEDTGNRE